MQFVWNTSRHYVYDEILNVTLRWITYPMIALPHYRIPSRFSPSLGFSIAFTQLIVRQFTQTHSRMRHAIPEVLLITMLRLLFK